MDVECIQFYLRADRIRELPFTSPSNERQRQFWYIDALAASSSGLANGA
jgi:hypothetical protein